MSGTGSAQLDRLGEAEAGTAGVSPHAAAGAALRQEAVERLAAHRLRRGARHGSVEGTTLLKRVGQRAGVVAAVAERYAHSPSYRAVLAEEARRAMERAEAEAAVAARNAKAIAVAQKELLAELDLWTAPQRFTAEMAQTTMTQTMTMQTIPVQPTPDAGPISGQSCTVSAPDVASPVPAAPIAEVSSSGITVRLYEDLPRLPVDEARLRRSADAPGELPTEEAAALEEEIAFRQAPVFDDFHSAGPVEPIAANLLEFPRQLIAPRKARPRYAEGPLREDTLDDWEPRGSQLRIFEVGAHQGALEPEPVSNVPEWTTIWLDAHTATPAKAVPGDETAILPSLLPPATASVHLRAMAAAVDGLLVGAAVLGFTALAVHSAGALPAGSMPSGPGAAKALAGVFALFSITYHLLFFSLAGQTAGMRYARIGLCTFTDENPSRAAMRKRVLAMLVAAAPLGLGLLWVWLDDDRLGWHDRMSRMYQRAY